MKVSELIELLKLLDQDYTIWLEYEDGDPFYYARDFKLGTPEIVVDKPSPNEFVYVITAKENK